MSTTTKAATNGSKASAGKNGKTTKPSNVVVPPAPKPKMRTLEDRLQCVNELKALTDKRNIFVKRRSEIREFNFGSDEHSADLIVQDQVGRKFQTRNGYLIKSLVNHLETMINEKITQIDQAILEFEV
ncbi:MAG: hypothetical protein JJ975_05970 [Bacteroidia bacterium]|nr:hypothetical protein [Bacteroidia bacterium]